MAVGRLKQRAVQLARVLLVEDDELTRDLLVKVLSRMGGFQVEVTEEPDRIVKMVGQKAVDVVLMDVSLTQSWMDGDEMDGVALTRLLKSGRSTRDVPVLLVSAFAVPSDAASMLQESGADGYVSKPVTDFQALLDKITGLLPQRSD